MKNSPPTASPTSLMAFHAGRVRMQVKTIFEEKTAAISARALTESTMREVAVKRLAKARSDMAALRARLNRSTP